MRNKEGHELIMLSANYESEKGQRDSDKLMHLKFSTTLLKDA